MTQVNGTSVAFGTPTSTTNTAPPLHEVRDTLRSVDLPSAAQSPFGPQRKREEQPPTIPGQRKASDALPTDFDVDHALGNYGPSDPWSADRWDAHSASDAFGAGLPRGAA